MVNTPQKPGKQRLRRVTSVVGIVALILVLAAGGAILGLRQYGRSEAGAERILNLINSSLDAALGGAGLSAVVDRVGGNLPFHIQLRGVHLADQEGIWLEAEQLDLALDWKGLLRRRITITNLEATHLVAHRLPRMDQKKQDENLAMDPALMFNVDQYLAFWPAFLHSFVLEHMQIKNSVVGPAFLGYAATLTLAGQASASPQAINLNILTTLAPLTTAQGTLVMDLAPPSQAQGEQALGSAQASQAALQEQEMPSIMVGPALASAFRTAPLSLQTHIDISIAPQSLVVSLQNMEAQGLGLALGTDHLLASLPGSGWVPSATYQSTGTIATVLRSLALEPEAPAPLAPNPLPAPTPPSEQPDPLAGLAEPLPEQDRDRATNIAPAPLSLDWVGFALQVLDRASLDGTLDAQIIDWQAATPLFDLHGQANKSNVQLTFALAPHKDSPEPDLLAQWQVEALELALYQGSSREAVQELLAEQFQGSIRLDDIHGDVKAAFQIQGQALQGFSAHLATLDGEGQAELNGPVHITAQAGTLVAMEHVLNQATMTMEGFLGGRYGIAAEGNLEARMMAGPLSGPQYHAEELVVEAQKQANGDTTLQLNLIQGGWKEYTGNLRAQGTTTLGGSNGLTPHGPINLRLLAGPVTGPDALLARIAGQGSILPHERAQLELHATGLAFQGYALSNINASGHVELGGASGYEPRGALALNVRTDTLHGPEGTIAFVEAQAQGIVAQAVTLHARAGTVTVGETILADLTLDGRTGLGGTLGLEPQGELGATLHAGHLTTVGEITVDSIDARASGTWDGPISLDIRTAEMSSEQVFFAGATIQGQVNLAGLLDLHLEARSLDISTFHVESAVARVQGTLAGPLRLEASSNGDLEAAVQAQWSPGSIHLDTFDFILDQDFVEGYLDDDDDDSATARPPVTVIRDRPRRASQTGAMQTVAATNPDSVAPVAQEGRRRRERRRGLGFKLGQPATITYGEHYIATSGLALDLYPTGQVQIQGSLGGNANNLRVSVEDVSLRQLRPFVPAIPSGRLEASATLLGSPYNPRGEITAQLRNLRMQNSSMRRIAFELGGTVAPAAGGGILELNLALSEADRVALDLTSAQAALRLPLSFNASGIPLLARDRELSGNVDWDGDLAPLWSLVPLADRRLSGSSSLHVQVEGTVNRPHLLLDAEIHDGEYEDLVAGVFLTAINVTAGVDNVGTIRVQGSATDGTDGSAQLQASLIPRQREFDARLEMENLKPLRRQDVRINIGGTAAAQGTIVAPQVTANLWITEGDVRLANLPGSSIRTLDITETNAQVGSSLDLNQPRPGEVQDGNTHLENLGQLAGRIERRSPGPPGAPGGPGERPRRGPRRQEPATPGSRGTLDATITIPNHFYVRGYGLDSEWQGQIEAKGSLLTPTITGSVTSVRGTMDFLSRNFTLDHGMVTLDGGWPVNPRLDILLDYESDNIVAGLHLNGTASSPNLELTSTPSLPDDEILSQILFGDSVSKLGPIEGLQLASAAASLAGFGRGGNFGIGFLGLGKQVLGADVLRLSSASGGDSDVLNSTVELGKYLTERVYVGVQQGVSADSTGVIINVDLTSSIKARGRANGEKSDFALRWQRNY